MTVYLEDNHNLKMEENTSDQSLRIKKTMTQLTMMQTTIQVD